MRGTEAFWIMIIAVSGMWAGVAMVRIIVEGWVKTKQEKLAVEREYLGQMMQEIEEIKQRLELISHEHHEQTPR